MLFLSKRAPFDLFEREQKGGIQLYVKRVFIMDKAAELLPPYLRFMRGLVDTADLPLNVSRELLQNNRTVEKIKSELVNRSLDLLEDLAADKPEAGLRVKVVGGGCSGLQYRMEIDSAKERDKIFERDGAKLIVDKKSFLYLNGSELDYAEELMASGFRLVNPNAKRSCGCGESFTV